MHVVAAKRQDGLWPIEICAFVDCWLFKRYVLIGYSLISKSSATIIYDSTASCPSETPPWYSQILSKKLITAHDATRQPGGSRLTGSASSARPRAFETSSEMSRDDAVVVKALHARHVMGQTVAHALAELDGVNDRSAES